MPVLLVDSVAEIAYRIYRNPTIGFSLLVPTRWSTDEISTATLAVFSAYTKDAEIVVRVSLQSDEKADAVAGSVKTVPRAFIAIIDRESFVVQKKEIGIISVHQYFKEGQKYLKRTLHMRDKEYAYELVCSAPLKAFYQYEEAFNIALKSFSPAGDVLLAKKSQPVLANAGPPEAEHKERQWCNQDFADVATDASFAV